MRLKFCSFALITGLGGLAAVHASKAPALYAAEDAKTIEITAKRFSYEPAEVTLKKGIPVTVVLHSEDVAHGLRVRELNFDLKAGKGATAQATLTPDKAGDFVGHCSTFCGSGHGAMSVTFHVVP